jgi:tripartite-type tricarboxylate transporter receptor subunit TctC
MSRLKQFFVAGILLLNCALAQASETYVFIVPNSPGTLSDTVARLVADEYKAMTGNTMVIDNVTGADGIIGITKFKNCKNTCVTVNGVAALVLNYYLKANLPYTRNDFDHVAWVGWVPNVWYTPVNSNIKNLEDVKTRLSKQIFTTVAHDFPSSAINIVALQKEYNNYTNFTRIPYKSSTQVMQDILAGQVDLAVGSANAGIYEQAKAGKIRIIGSTNPANISVIGQTIPTTMGFFGNAPQYQAAQVISISPGVKDAETEKLKRDILTILKLPKVIEKLRSMTLVVPANELDGIYVNEQLLLYEKQLKLIDLNPRSFE